MAQDLLVVFQKGSLKQEITSDTPVLTDVTDFTKAECKKGECIIYSHENYNQDDSDGFKILKQGQGAVDITGFGPRSVRRVASFGTESVTLYEHNYYGGRALNVADRVNNVQLGNGVSSMIVSGGRWGLYIHPDFHGPNTTKGAGYYATPGDMGFPNDSVKSIERND